MKRYRLNILGISEVRWKGQGDFDSDGVRVIYSGGDECQREVAVMLDGEVAKRVTCVEQVSDRILAVKISAMPVDMLIVQIYMPTTDHEDEEVEEMYDKIEKIMDKEKGRSNVIIMGDFNASVGEGNDENGNKVWAGEME